MMEAFSIVEEAPEQRLIDTFTDLTSGKTADHDVVYQATLKARFPDLTLTSVPTQSCNFLAFAGAGNAIVELDNTTDPKLSWRGWIPKYGRSGTAGIGETVFFAKYHFNWNGEDFILYVVGGVQYVLKEPQGDETALTPSRITDKLIEAAGTWQTADRNLVWVFDDYWRPDRGLWQSVQKAKWENVILDENMKKDLTSVANKFFDNEQVYKNLGVPWKRGIIFHGPAGNGKTVSIKALMHTLYDRKRPIQSLYVKFVRNTYAIRQIFEFARSCSPCMLIFEDIETIVNDATRSYFLNEVDGLESNDGILMVASTNFLERLDPGITKRPSRFDRKYLFPLPNLHERTLYAEYWRHKISNDANRSEKIEFPERLCPAIAAITKDFSFAYMQEAFVATLLIIAHEEIDSCEPPGRSAQTSFHPGFNRSAASQALYSNLNPSSFYSRDPYADLEDIRLWRIFRDQVRILREDMDSSDVEPVSPAHETKHDSTDHYSSPLQTRQPGQSIFSASLQQSSNQLWSCGPHRANHALQDYQMQLMLLEQQNKKRLLMARQESDSAGKGLAHEGPAAHLVGVATNKSTGGNSSSNTTTKSAPSGERTPYQLLPSLPLRPRVGPFEDIPSTGAAGFKIPSLNPAAFKWGPS